MHRPRLALSTELQVSYKRVGIENDPCLLVLHLRGRLVSWETESLHNCPSSVRDKHDSKGGVRLNIVAYLEQPIQLASL